MQINPSLEEKLNGKSVLDVVILPIDSASEDSNCIAFLENQENNGSKVADYLARQGIGIIQNYHGLIVARMTPQQIRDLSKENYVENVFELEASYL
ncbi:MAG: hypothetical protein AABX05_04625 [Nanoarchaeota archaeon]